MQSLFKNVKKGFTLAEILVTLGIIGMIASMTIPNLVQDIQDAQYKTAWKKTYAEFEQVMKRVLLDNSGSIKNVCPDNDDNCLKDLFLPYLNYTKSCNKGQTFGNCFNNTRRYLDGTLNINSNNAAGAIINNGALLYFDFFNSKYCTDPFLGIPNCGMVMVDVNGFKTPNTFGKDIFGIHVRENEVKPWGIQGDVYYNKCEGSTGSGSGAGCGAKYLYQ